MTRDKYIIKLFDRPLLEFEASADAAESNYEIVWVDENNRQLLPFDLELSAAGIEHWIKQRNIPKNRAFANTFLARSGLNANRPLGIISLSKGLSLNDCYWVSTPGDPSTFSSVNLYDNPISRLLAEVAFTGEASSRRSVFVSSPEFTTNGMLPKCWRRIDGLIYLYKGGTSGFANAGYEPFSEFYASDISVQIGVNSIDYGLHEWKGSLCSSCKLFTSKKFSFVPARSFVKGGSWDSVVSEYFALGKKFVEALSDMVAFDALICNTDRHLNNFGILVNSSTNKIHGPAPLFDHGNSLFYQAYGDDWSDADSLSKYAATQSPCLYDDFFDTAREIMTSSTRAKIEKAINFSFNRKAIKGFPKQRLRLIEEQIRRRASALLE